eukprot:scaffold1740_cov109-Isochrysis_galbana.AAC.2
MTKLGHVGRARAGSDKSVPVAWVGGARNRFPVTRFEPTEIRAAARLARGPDFYPELRGAVCGVVAPRVGCGLDKRHSPPGALQPAALPPQRVVVCCPVAPSALPVPNVEAFVELHALARQRIARLGLAGPDSRCRC